MRHLGRAVLATLLFAASLQNVSAEPDQTSDPAQDYQTRFQMPADLRLDVDLNGDGYPEVFLSNERRQNGRAGRVWTVYQGNPQGWRMLEKPATFRERPLQIVPATKDTPAGLLTFWPGGAGAGVVQRIGLTEDGITEETVEEIPESAVTQYFDSSSPLSIAAKPPTAFAASVPAQPAPLQVVENTPKPRIKERTVARTWIIAGIAVLLIFAVLYAAMRRK